MFLCLIKEYVSSSASHPAHTSSAVYRNPFRHFPFIWIHLSPTQTQQGAEIHSIRNCRCWTVRRDFESWLYAMMEYSLVRSNSIIHIHNIFLWKIEKWKSNKNSPFYGINFLEKKYDIFAEGIKGTRSKKNCFKNNIYCYLTQKGKESKNIICKDFIWKRNGLNGKFTYPRMNVRMSEYSSFVVEWLWIIFFLSIRRMKKELE